VTAISAFLLDMNYFPIFLEMTGRRCLVIGGGAVAERKIAGLLEAGAHINVISPEVSAAIQGWCNQQELTLTGRRYREGDLADFPIVFVATHDRDVNERVYREGRRCGAWVNAADDPAHCDFILPSVFRRGLLTVAVSSGGGSPALARTIREELEIYLNQEYEQLAKLAAEVRAELRKHSLNVPFETWRRALSGEVRQLLMGGEVVRAKSHLLKELGVSL
jgi:siroheme synthase-like protein